MNDPKYSVSISYVAPKTSGLSNISVGGVTYSVSTQTSEYFVASMPLANLYATGSTYRAALDNLLILATASTTVDPMIIPFKPTW